MTSLPLIISTKLHWLQLYSTLTWHDQLAGGVDGANSIRCGQVTAHLPAQDDTKRHVHHFMSWQGTGNSNMSLFTQTDTDTEAHRHRQTDTHAQSEYTGQVRSGQIQYTCTHTDTHTDTHTNHTHTYIYTTTHTTHTLSRT